jgi:cell division septation protein DedD
MRSWIVAVGLVTLAAAPAQAQQQGSVQLSSSAQVVVADPERRAGQAALEPDLGLTVYQPGFRFGTLFIDIHAVRRAEHARVGQSSFGLREVKLGGLTWTVTAGDSAVTPALSGYSFTNLFAPQVTFSGGHVAGFARRGSVTLTAGRVTALRNIFGSDPQTVGQDMGQLNARFRPSPAVEVFARASHVRTRDAREFTWFIARGDDVGGGVRVRPIPTVELTADAGVSRYVRRGATEREQSATALLGGKWTLSRGWLEVNAQRFAPGYFAVLNTPYTDREGAYAAGEIMLAKPLRLFGGFEAFRTNLEPDSSAEGTMVMPRRFSQRAFAGARLHVGGRTFLTLRAEDGDRTSRAIRQPGANFDSDTGVVTAEMQSAVKGLTGFARYERRENVDHANGTGTYGQHTGSLQVFGRLKPGFQLFGSAMLIQQDRQPGGQTFLQGGGGFQLQLRSRPLWLRAEGLFTRSDDWETDTVLPHELFTVGLSGQLTPRTSLSFDVMFDRAPQQTASTSPWLGRSMIRLMHTLPTGSARVRSATRVTTRRGRRSLGTLGGLAYADWNANGVRDEGEEPLSGVPFVFSGSELDEVMETRVTTGPAGEFAFVNVPQGRARVGLDLTALPVDYDPPTTTSRETEVRDRRGDKLAFGLVPLGSVTGQVLQDTDNDGREGPADVPVEGAVLLLDNGERSEQTRGGAFRFDAVRPGPHTVTLLRESLPENALLSGEHTREMVLGRTDMQATVRYLVRFEKRPEIRRVFPSKSVSRNGRPATPPPSAPAVARATEAPAPAATMSPTGPPRETAPRVWFAIQLAATHDRASARQLVDDLQRRGVDAYLSEDADGLAKVRVGSYRSRAAAGEELARLNEQRIEGWIAKIGGR